jgi:hypothetical protein
VNHRATFTALILFASACATTPNAKITSNIDAPTPQLVGRWIFSPGDSSLAQDPKAAKSDEAIESPAGASLSLGEGGVVTARAGDFVRRGTWKVSAGTLKMIIDPPPERRELSFVPRVEIDQLTLQGSDGSILVYLRDPFVALPSPSQIPIPTPKKLAPAPTKPVVVPPKK